jgi:GH18 family chitinase
MLIGTTDGGRKNGGLLGLCRRYKLDGVDFDWEAPRGPEEFRNYASLLREARIFLGRHGLTISVAIHPGAELGVSDLGESADFVHLMAYDFSGGNRGHSSFDDAVGAAKRLRDLADVPSEKIRLGLPGYGANEAGETRTFAELSELYGADRAQLPDWARNVEDKIAWAKEAGLGGVFLWEVGHDILPLQPRSLLSRMSRAARGHRPPSRGEL